MTQDKDKGRIRVEVWAVLRDRLKEKCSKEGLEPNQIVNILIAQYLKNPELVINSMGQSTVDFIEQPQKEKIVLATPEGIEAPGTQFSTEIEQQDEEDEVDLF